MRCVREEEEEVVLIKPWCSRSLREEEGGAVAFNFLSFNVVVNGLSIQSGSTIGV